MIVFWEIVTDTNTIIAQFATLDCINICWFAWYFFFNFALLNFLQWSPTVEIEMWQNLITAWTDFMNMILFWKKPSETFKKIYSNLKSIKYIGLLITVYFMTSKSIYFTVWEITIFIKMQKERKLMFLFIYLFWIIWIHM